MSANDEEHFELEELAVQPGLYFNPQTEVVVIVDDNFSADPDDFQDDGEDEGRWLRISDEVPIDEQARDELFEDYLTKRRPEQTDEDEYEDEEELEPDDGHDILDDED